MSKSNGRRIKSNKGFIGTIGDDLPSLIPIFIGLLVFFSVFLNTYNVYKNNTDIYSLQQEAISISITLKENSLIPNYESFNNTCKKINTNKNWSAFIVDLPLNVENITPLDPNNINILEYTENGYSYPYICGTVTDPNDLPIVNSDITKIIYMYPITIQKQFSNNRSHAVPAKLYIMIWDD
jgi:hypothetical protein